MFVGAKTKNKVYMFIRIMYGKIYSLSSKVTYYLKFFFLRDILFKVERNINLKYRYRVFILTREKIMKIG